MRLLLLLTLILTNAYSNLLPGKEKTQLVRQVFNATASEYISALPLHCELGFIDILKHKLQEAELGASFGEVDLYIGLMAYKEYMTLEMKNYLQELNWDFERLQGKFKPKLKFDRLDSRKGREILNHNDIIGLYRDINQQVKPNNVCLHREHLKLLHSVSHPKFEKLSIPQRTSILHLTNLKALDSELITLSTYKKLDYLRKRSFVSRKKYTLQAYLDELSNHKKNLGSSYEFF